MISVANPSPLRLTNWIPIVGKWTFEGDTARYEGPLGGGAPFGLALGSERFRGGRISFALRFEQPLGGSAGGIAVGYSAQDPSYVQVALGSFERAYAIQEYMPSAGWRLIADVGSAEHLTPGRAYRCSVRQQGQRLSLEVEGVRVLEKVLASPLSGDQLGLFTYGEKPVVISNVTMEPQRPRVFVAMQFSEPFDTFYEHVIRPVALEDEFNFEVVRIDEKHGPGIIFQEIKNEIADASIVVAEVTAPNENVFYELGYAHALNKPTILLAQRGKQLPFDIRSNRVIFYDDTIGGKNEVEEQLRNHFRAIVKE
jgi:hypothetical protein